MGQGYDEDLLRGMAEARDGNFEHIEHASQLPAFFEAEFHGMSRTTGHTVSLGIEPNPDLGSLRQEVVNDFQKNDLGRVMLRKLISGRPLEVVFTVHLPAQAAQADLVMLRLRLEWTGRDGIRRKTRTQLNLPVLPEPQFNQLAEDDAVQVALEVQLNARAKRDAIHLMDAGDYYGSQHLLQERERVFSTYEMLPDRLRKEESCNLSDLAQGVVNNAPTARKQANIQNFNRSRSK